MLPSNRGWLLSPCCFPFSPSTLFIAASLSPHFRPCSLLPWRFRDLRAHLVDVVTFGQYLRPTKRHMKVAEYVTPVAFDAWKREAESMGFLYVASGPLVRSSYKAGELFLTNAIKQSRRNQQQQQQAQAEANTATGANDEAAAPQLPSAAPLLVAVSSA